MSSTPPDPRRPKKRSGEHLIHAAAMRLRGPESRDQLQSMFRDEAACRLYLAALRWPERFSCPHCGSEDGAEASGRGLLRCVPCGVVSSPTHGTLFERSALPLRSWFSAIWEVVSREQGASPAAVAAALPQPELLWGWLANMRAIYRQAWHDRLCGVVELARVPVDVAIGPSRERRRMGHRMVAIAVEAKGDTGRVRLQRLGEVDASSMLAFARRAVAPGSTVRTSAWCGYRRLHAAGYGHIRSFGSDGNDDGTLRHAQHIASVLRLWLWSSDALEVEHLDYYLEEFVFRINARLRYPNARRGAFFNELLRLATRPTRMRAVQRIAG